MYKNTLNLLHLLPILALNNFSLRFVKLTRFITPFSREYSKLFHSFFIVPTNSTLSSMDLLAFLSPATFVSFLPYKPHFERS